MPTRVLMVCLGNICRSPLAEGIFREIAGAEFEVDSAGTAGYHVGNPPDPRSIAIARKNNIDISLQRCRQFQSSDFHDFDYIFAMDHANYSNILALAQNPQDEAKVALLLQAGGMGNMEVPDPYYGGDQGFARVFEMIREACLNIYQNIRP
ncbi:protein-tyrosine phosphatase [Robiginitalea myxolifaciens]|uniref:protein-tyrosine-phosphatase n=1 Tax=Robiginitalea myxolifaciens TaxID=400055 RepID=A0A1I6GRT0_9FLAO|nr:low molecular weight protein-tyrosine-phosphatase [Robiginitalea myxolifaciens]SFR44902.1 protein-tyrosine phosphatase [Robiginitalea myxolifaciens]